MYSHNRVNLHHWEPLGEEVCFLWTKSSVTALYTGATCVMSATFTVAEIAELCSSREAVKWFEAHLLNSPSLFQEAVHALCSQLTRGKDLCSPTKRVKLKANKVFFAKLAGFLVDKTHGLRLGGGGSSSGNGADAGASLGSSISRAASIQCSFSLNSSIVSSSSGGSFKSDTVTLSPRSSLYGAPPSSSPLHISNQSPEDLNKSVSVLDFSKSLAAQSPRWGNIPPDEILSLSLLIDSCSDGLSNGCISTRDFLSFSQKVDDCLNLLHDTSTARQNEAFAELYETLVRERIARSAKDVQAKVPTETALKILDPALVARIQQFAGAARASKRHPLTVFCQIFLSGPAAQRLDLVLSMLRTDGAFLVGDEGSGEMRIRADVCAQIDMRFDGELELESSFDLSPRAGSIGYRGRTSPQSHSRQGQQSLAQSAAALDIDDSMTKLRENATSLASKLASQSESLDATMNIWAALQNLELELKKAAPSSSSKAVKAAAATAIAAGKKSKKRTVLAIQETRQALDRTIEPNLSMSTANVSLSISMAQSPPKWPPTSSTNLKGGGGRPRDSSSSEVDHYPVQHNGAAHNGKAASAGGSNKGGIATTLGSGSHQMVTPILAQRHRERAVSRNGKATTPLPFQPQPRAQSAAQPRGGRGARAGPEQQQQQQQQPPVRPPTMQHTMRTLAPSDRANLSIFKSPGRRQVSENVNTYDSNTFSWVPTKLTGKYNARFQTTHELMDAKKIFSVFYQTDE